MKKIISVLFVSWVLSSSLLFAGKWSFSTTGVLQISPASKSETTVEAGENHFAPITGPVIPIPFAQFSARYLLPLDFGDNLLFMGSSLSFSSGLALTPVSFTNQFSIGFTPIPLLSFSFGSSIGTSWGIGELPGMAKYNSDKGTFEAFKPLEAWNYSFSAQASTQFDFGIFAPGEWNHIITTASYSVRYEGCTAVRRQEIWSMSGGENVNGLSYSASVLLGYMMPLRVRLVGLSASFSGRFSGEDYGIYNDNYDGKFVSISFGLQTMISITDRNSLAIMASIPSHRAFSDEAKTGELTLSRKTAGREWTFGGITLSWTYSF